MKLTKYSAYDLTGVAPLRFPRVGSPLEVCCARVFVGSSDADCAFKLVVDGDEDFLTGLSCFEHYLRVEARMVAALLAHPGGVLRCTGPFGPYSLTRGR